ncbi:SprT family zinc-dependent metalloprotease [Kaistia dalseonensis]|uniref:Metal-dependent hydrolase n=1 Tax=Kaistia dalseonensis TaxID=410840 RepID=A0ABU0H5X0_9HYPH|nr:SprT family zinc-dependent metalloprotease [Kaistia dalseonensis]MCX5495103.1 SprT family zinc-dependent metalloprotease [Kaistia dalseonensis]MDQ0437685.1 putative metal-dependent hydrolase [Kaistia dalseonensis]
MTRPKAAKPDHCHVDIDGEIVRVALLWNDRARRYTLRLRGSVREPVVTIPARGALAEARAFVERNRGWLKARLAALPAATPIVDGAVIQLRGEPVRLLHRPGRGTAALDRSEGEAFLIVNGEPAHLPRRVMDFLKREARQDLEAATRRHAAALGVTVKAIRLGDPTSRWGSCSSSGTIAYSWRVIMAPPFVLDYLVAHEVAHLREMNHSPRFWRLVAELCPGMEAAKSWLNRHGATLHAVGAA